MRIPVLVVVPSQTSLVESALEAATGQPPSVPVGAALPAGVEPDPEFTAVPLGTGRPETTVLESLQPQASESFVLRGFVEADSQTEVPEERDGRPMFADPQIAPFLTCGGSPPLGNAATVQAKLRVSQLAAKRLDGAGVAVAIMDTGINLAHLTAKLGRIPAFDVTNSWTPAGVTNLPGRHPVDHGTMCAFDALLAAPAATLLDYPILAGRAPGGAVVGRTISVALLGYAQLIAGWAVAFAPGGAARYGALVVSNSWGIYHPSWDFPPGHRGRFCDNPRHPFNVLAATLAASGADILFAAGNCGSQCADMRCQGRVTGAIMGTNALPDVLTLAGCDTADLRVGYSSQGPSIAGMFPQKPDVTTYTHFLGSEAFGTGSPDSGTSASCPVAAGCVAAIRTRMSPQNLPPANLFDQLRLTARPAAGQLGWNGDYGHGLLDPLAAAQSLGL